MRYILADTGFWIALFDGRDDIKKNNVAEEIFSYVQNTRIKIIITPSILSELLRTRFFKENKKLKIDFLEKILKSDLTEEFDDSKYKKEALSLTLIEGKRCRSISYVDNIIRLMIRDYHKNIQYLITFNINDFRDVCNKYNVDIYEKCYAIIS
ncbi:Uncharacterised protein [uncultured archaeon]|nr:Uncharacterised protein [uncultured archaeon]